MIKKNICLKCKKNKNKKKKKKKAKKKKKKKNSKGKKNLIRKKQIKGIYIRDYIVLQIFLFMHDFIVSMQTRNYIVLQIFLFIYDFIVDASNMSCDCIVLVFQAKLFFKI